MRPQRYQIYILYTYILATKKTLEDLTLLENLRVKDQRGGDDFLLVVKDAKFINIG